MSASEKISITLENGEEVEICIVADNPKSLQRIDNTEASSNLEAPVQLLEGYQYEYQLTNGYSIAKDDQGIVLESKLNPSTGRLSPNIYVGTLHLDIENIEKQKCGSVELEVQSIKTDYRSEYRFMLEEITEKCTDLLMQYTSPANQPFDIDHESDSETLYQRFAFLKSVLESEELWTAVHRITTNPVSSWVQTEESRDIRSVRKMNRNVVRQLAGSPNRVPLPKSHPLCKNKKMESVPAKVITLGKTDTVDTPENRFIKFALETFKNLCADFKTSSKENTRLHRESAFLEEELEEALHHSIFQKISRPVTLPLNSPVLQRKEGYREILRVWLMINLAARLTWAGGQDVYSGGKRDVATLYEYWLFFKLTELLEDLFGINALAPKDLIEETNDKLGLKLRQGRHLPLDGTYETKNRILHVQFSFNKTFGGENSYPKGGSWTRSMRPDYTLSIWPEGISETVAEQQELIVHLHFDAKYKVESLTTLFGQNNEDLNIEKEEQNKGTYKRADLLKMHSYRDAIRRTAGAYILYPGGDGIKDWRGFHEIVPGLGAFTLKPNRQNNGSLELRAFLKDVIAHFQNRASQRESYSFQTYRTFKSSDDNEVNELLPEPFGENRDLVPDETFVLVGFYKSEEHLDWIINHGLYNTRISDKNDRLNLRKEETEARFLLIRTHNETTTSRLFSIKRSGPIVLSKRDLIDKGYPSEPSKDYYLVYEIEKLQFDELRNKSFDVRLLSAYKKGRKSALPFSVSLSELMKAKV
tara:strand:- start:1511 stop:3784 length:2274 start_codon:yes stop_codon:yes gene_type:complete